MNAIMHFFKTVKKGVVNSFHENMSCEITTKKNWNSLAFLSALFVVALTARLFSLILDPLLQRDAASYLLLAERWQETGDYAQTLVGGVTPVPPLPLFTIVKMMDLGFQSEIGGRSIALFLGAMIPILGYYISYIVFKNSLISAISTLILIFHPNLVSYSIQPLRENFYLLFLGLTSIAFIKGIKYKKIKDWGLCGMILAFAVYSRYEALELLFFCPLVLLILWFKKKLSFKATTRFLCVLFMSFFATSVLLLSITNFNISFISKILEYHERATLLNDVHSLIQNDPQSNK